MEYIFFDGWDGIIRVIITTIVAYFVVIAMLRISGKRTLAKMNAFDFIVTIALGSILGAVILNKKIPLAEGLFAVALLICLQYLITFISVRSRGFKKFISSDPTLLFYKGNMLNKVLKKERISIGEVYKSVREAGEANFENIDAIVLEATGDITIIQKVTAPGDRKAMEDVQNLPGQ